MKLETILGYPKIVITDNKLIIGINKWLKEEEYPSLKTYKQKKLSKLQIIEIENKLGFLLKEIGINKNETCILSNFDENLYTFNCHLKESNIDILINLRWKNETKEIIVEKQNTKEVYTYNQEKLKKPKLNLKAYTITNEQNSNTYYRYLSKKIISIKLQNQNNYLELNIEKPNKNETLKLENESEITNYLLNLNFPINLEEVYNTLNIKNINEYQKISLKLITTSTKEATVTDEILIKNGRIEKYTITKNNITITLNQDGSWIYDGIKIKITEDACGNIQYKLKSKKDLELLNLTTPLAVYDDAQIEIEKAKQLRKNLHI